MTRQCELCSLPARMYCEADQASLCWECDAKVHGANFLVARHTRSLLCQSCQEPTAWRASGSRLGPIVSVCDRCLGTIAEGGGCDAAKGETGFSGAGEVGGGRIEEEAEEGVGDMGVEVDGEDDEDGEGEDDQDLDDDEEDNEDGDNQVVPWSMEAEATPPPVASCSSSDESSSGRTAICQGFLKRMRQNANPSSSSSSSHWQDELVFGPSPWQPGYLRPSSPTAATAVHSGRTWGDYEEGASPLGTSRRPLMDRKRAAAPPAAAGLARRDRLPRGTSSAVDVFIPNSPSPPI